MWHTLVHCLRGTETRSGDHQKELDSSDGPSPTDNEPTPTLAPDQPYWDSRRRRLRDWLRRNAPSLAELYEAALAMLHAPNFPGRVRLVAHAVREIGNALPNVIAGEKARTQVQYKNAFDKIERMWASAALPVDGSLPTSLSNNASATDEHARVPAAIFSELGRLVGQHTAGRERPTDAASRLFRATQGNEEAGDAELAARVSAWLDLLHWFFKHVHDQGKCDDDIEHKELLRRFRLFESTLFSLQDAFFATLEELDEILEDANS